MNGKPKNKPHVKGNDKEPKMNKPNKNNYKQDKTNANSKMMKDYNDYSKRKSLEYDEAGPSKYKGYQPYRKRNDSGNEYPFSNEPGYIKEKQMHYSESNENDRD